MVPQAQQDEARAAEIHNELLEKLEAWHVRPADDLRDAAAMSDIWAARARLLRRLGNRDEADLLDRRRTEMWAAWGRKQPNNVFVRRQIKPAGL